VDEQNSPMPKARLTRARTLASSLIDGDDLVVALIVLAGCALLYYFTTQFKEIASILSESTPPAFFPRLLIWTIVVLAVLLPFEHHFHARGKKHLGDARRHRIKPISIVTAGLLIATVASIQWLGTLITMVLVCVALPLLWGERRASVILPFALLFPGIVTFLFTKVLKVVFEPGILALVFP
jgi:putative tricarboxylic transport membrane protein